MSPQAAYATAHWRKAICMHSWGKTLGSFILTNGKKTLSLRGQRLLLRCACHWETVTVESGQYGVWFRRNHMKWAVKEGQQGHIWNFEHNLHFWYALGKSIIVKWLESVVSKRAFERKFKVNEVWEEFSKYDKNTTLLLYCISVSSKDRTLFFFLFLPLLSTLHDSSHFKVIYLLETKFWLPLPKNNVGFFLYV